MSRPNLQRIYLTLLALIFLIAFLSYDAQFEGLLSSSGIEPSSRIFPYAFPKINAWLTETYGLYKSDVHLSVDSMCKLVAILGVIASCIASSGTIQNGLIFLSMTVLYYFLVALGGTFYSFQWDILLIETGFVTSLCYAPWLHVNVKANQHAFSNTHLGAWPLRLLLFKLMFMSGVVKVQSGFQWVDLTALEYHFATQCLPSTLAWYAHQLHPFFLRVSVAMTLLIEIFASFLLISPMVLSRRIGATLQIYLQILIMISGNYNFFNILTISLCLPCLGGIEIESERVKNGENMKLKNNTRKLEKCTEIFLTIGYLVWSFSLMFDYGSVNSNAPHLSGRNKYLTISLSRNFDCDQIINKVIPFIIPVMVSFLFWSFFRGLRITRSYCNLIHFAVCTCCIAIISFPLVTLSPELRKGSFSLLMTNILPIWKQIEPLHISNSYGLFRRMTGVGDINKHLSSSDQELWGWANLLPSFVERPEIILEGLFISMDDHGEKVEDWYELNFKWKPGNVSNRPKQVAPYQPRLDWQMWFAALGSYQNNPWLLNLLYKLLQGCPGVTNLLNEPLLSSRESEFVKIRARLYNYDFTRWESDWSRGLPGTSTNKHPSQWWTRKFSHEYLPPIDINNPSLKKFLISNHFDIRCDFPKTRCSRCKDLSVGYMCDFMRFIDEKKIIWLPVICLICIPIRRLCKTLKASKRYKDKIH